MLAEATRHNLEVLWFILALGAFACAIVAAFRSLIPAAVACALIGVLILVFAL